jgi:hypothetical protein
LTLFFYSFCNNKIVFVARGDENKDLFFLKEADHGHGKESRKGKGGSRKNRKKIKKNGNSHLRSFWRRRGNKTMGGRDSNWRGVANSGDLRRKRRRMKIWKYVLVAVLLGLFWAHLEDAPFVFKG